MELKIIQCHLKHHAVLAEIGASTFYESYHTQNTQADMEEYIGKTYHTEITKKHLLNPNIVYFLCYHPQGDIGFVKLLLNQAHTNLQGKNAEIEKIYVRANFQGTGVAQKLMETASKFCKEQHFENVFLGVWQENHRAIKFYQKEGFEIFDTRSFKLGSRICDDYVMALKL
jgi:ribosomal protein S18 acetylase RimI-like enzyme